MSSRVCSRAFRSSFFWSLDPRDHSLATRSYSSWSRRSFAVSSAIRSRSRARVRVGNSGPHLVAVGTEAVDDLRGEPLGDSGRGGDVAGGREEHGLERRQARGVHAVERDLLDLGHLQQERLQDGGFALGAIEIEREGLRHQATEIVVASEQRLARRARDGLRPGRRGLAERRREAIEGSSQRSVSSSLSAARRRERSAGSQIGSQSTVGSLQRRSIMEIANLTDVVRSELREEDADLGEVRHRDAVSPGRCSRSLDRLESRVEVFGAEKPLERVGDRGLAVAARCRHHLRRRRTHRGCAPRPGPRHRGLGGRLRRRGRTVGGPIEMAGMAGREREAEFAPTSIARVTTTAGAAAGAVTALAEDAGCAVAATASRQRAARQARPRTARCAPRLSRVPLRCLRRLRRRNPRRVDFVDGGAPFGACPFACGGAPAPRPSFGGRCIGPSSAVLVDGVSVSPLLGAPEKSLEKTLNAEHQP